VNALADHAAPVVPGIGDVDPARWLDRFDDMFAEVAAPAFCGRESRLRLRSYLLGQMFGLERKNGCTDTFLGESYRFFGEVTGGIARRRGAQGPPIAVARSFLVMF
jgi:hypothetical protein